jgi:N-acetylglutamate synthase-like GNAT family acetyltransferase
VVIGKPFDNSRIPAQERFDPEAAALAIHQQGTRATAIEKVEDIVAYTVDLVRPGDVVVVFSSGSFEGLHDKLLFELGDAIIPARRDDQPKIVALLKQYELDWHDVGKEDYRKFLCLINEHGVVGCVGLEVYGEEAVLRSLAVMEEHRGGGYGWMLADTVINMARRRGVRRIYLVTATASDFFAEKHGFRTVDPSTISSALTQSNTFKRRDGKQVAMRLDL